MGFTCLDSALDLGVRFESDSIYFCMTWTLGEGSACATQTNFVALITAQLAAPSAPLAIRKVPVPGAVASQA